MFLYKSLLKSSIQRRDALVKLALNAYKAVFQLFTGVLLLANAIANRNLHAAKAEK